MIRVNRSSLACIASPSSSVPDRLLGGGLDRSLLVLRRSDGGAGGAMCSRKAESSSLEGIRERVSAGRAGAVIPPLLRDLMPVRAVRDRPVDAPKRARRPHPVEVGRAAPSHSGGVRREVRHQRGTPVESNCVPVPVAGWHSQAVHGIGDDSGHGKKSSCSVHFFSCTGGRWEALGPLPG